MKGKVHQRPRGIGGHIKAIFRYLLVHAGCLSPNDQDDIPMSTRRDHRRASGLNEDSINANLNTNNRHVNSNDNNKNNNNNYHYINDYSRRRRSEPKDNIFKDGIEEKQDNIVLNKNSGTMFSLQNCTLHCDVCRNGETYWASFTERSFHRGHKFKLYRGIINGQGPQSGEKCVVKVFLHRPGTKELCLTEVRKSEKLRQLARSFNQRCKRLQDKIRCPQTFWAQVDEVSKLKQLFFTGERKLVIGEHVLFQPDIRIADDKPGKPRKVSRFMDAKGKQFGHQKYPVLDAFLHYTYHITNGDLVACGFEGVLDEEGFSFITPIIHSKGHTFGEGDLGEEGIMTLFNNHICNNLCHDLTIPSIPKPFNNGVTMATEEARVEEEDVEESSSMMSDFPNGSVNCSTRPLIPDTGTSIATNSKVSEYTESMSGYLEPSAPEMDDFSLDELTAPPPAYTQERAEQVFHWLIQEESSNSFLRVLPPSNGPFLSPLPYPTACRLSERDQISLFASAGQIMTRASSDINANVSAGHLPFNRNPASIQYANRQRDMSTRSSEVMETNSNGSSSYFSSNRTTSEATAARSDVAMESSSGSSCSSPFLHSRSREGSTCSSRSVDNAIYRDHHRLIYRMSEDNRNTRLFQEQPPSYEESEIHATRCFLVENNIMPSSTRPLSTNTLIRNLDSGFQSHTWLDDTSTTPLIHALPDNQNEEVNIPVRD